MDYQHLVRVAPRRGALQKVAGPVGAALGALACPTHPILGCLGGYALLKNSAALATGQKSVKETVQGLGNSAAGTAAALLLPQTPILGYVSGRIAGKIFIPRIIGEAEKRTAFFRRPVKLIGGMPVWKAALLGGGLIGVGFSIQYGLHRHAFSYASNYAKNTWSHLRNG